MGGGYSELHGARGILMKRFIIFGTGHFLSDIFDIIHAVGGQVYKIYQNMPEVRLDRTIPLEKRLSFLPYKVSLYDSLDLFQPEEGCEYALGFTVVQKFHLVEHLKGRYPIRFCSLVHPEAYLGSNVTLGEGVVVSPRAVVAPNTILEDFCLLNRMASIGHDVRIGKYSRLGPSSVVAAFCRIGTCTAVGVGATILDRICIGDGSVIGAGALVTKDIPGGVVAYGSPAKVIRENRI
jgi:sugar O-acyltransferase (sialic acid O-acetyltransferase NeuD family)